MNIHSIKNLYTFFKKSFISYTFNKHINEINKLEINKTNLNNKLKNINLKIDSIVLEKSKLEEDKLSKKKNIVINNQKLNQINNNIPNINQNIKKFDVLIKEEKINLKKVSELNKQKEIAQSKLKELNQNKIDLQLEIEFFKASIDIIEKEFVKLDNLLKTKKQELDNLNFNLIEVEDEINIQDNLKGIKNKKIKKINTFFILLTPIFIFAVYFYGLGRPKYYVESDVLVRKTLSSNESGNPLSSLLGVGNRASREDALFLKIYLQSPQVLEDILKKIDFKKAYRKKGFDIYSGINLNISRENLYDFFKKQVEINYDNISGSLNIVTLGYDPLTSFQINNFLIDKAEIFVNELNQNIYKRQIDFVEKQVTLNFDNLSEANSKLQDFQNQTKILNLDQEVISSTGLISSLEQQLMESQLELSFLKRQFVDQNVPEIQFMKTKIEELKNQIKDQRNILLSPKAKNYVERIGISNSLKSNVKFWSDIYNSSLATFEKTKLDSQKQQRFLAILSNPLLPETQNMGWRNKWFLTFTFIILIGYFLTRFVLGISESHND
tara:strand:+ start:6772 stop:8430 length:1659 start_codon:yes stop_codon:yes gene_type:complete